MIRTDATPEQRVKWQQFIQQGYDMCVVDRDGVLCPGYADYMLEFVLDYLELMATLDSLKLANGCASAASADEY